MTECSRKKERSFVVTVGKVDVNSGTVSEFVNDLLVAVVYGQVEGSLSVEISLTVGHVRIAEEQIDNLLAVVRLRSAGEMERTALRHPHRDVEACPIVLEEPHGRFYLAKDNGEVKHAVSIVIEDVGVESPLDEMLHQMILAVH
jgi:hypothetical protein